MTHLLHRILKGGIATIRRHPRNKVYKDLEPKQDLDISKHKGMSDMDRLYMLVGKTLRITKSDQNGAYMNDLKMLPDISQKEMSAVVKRMTRVPPGSPVCTVSMCGCHG